MFSISDPKLEPIGQDIIEGRSKKALSTLNKILDTELEIDMKKLYSFLLLLS